MLTQKTKVCVVVPVYNESENIANLYQVLNPIFEALAQPYEFSICFVDDGSTDDSLLKIQDLNHQDPRVQWISLSRNFGKEIALTAGLDHADGDAVILMDADLQHPADLIPQFLSTWEQGVDVVYAQIESRDHEHWLKRFLSQQFYMLLSKMTDIPIPAHAGDFRLLSLRAVQALRSMPEQCRYLKGMYAWIGFQQVAIPYVPHIRRSGRSKWSYRQLFGLAIEGITSFSRFPLKLASYFGFAVAGTGFLYAAYVLIKTFLFGDPVKGFPSLMIVILFLGGIQLMTLGILGEYLGRNFQEIKRRPLYLCKDASSSLSPPSTVMRGVTQGQIFQELHEPFLGTHVGRGTQKTTSTGVNHQSRADTNLIS